MSTIAQSNSAQMIKYVKIFRELDTSGDGSISAAELQEALGKSGIRLSVRDFNKFLSAVDVDGSGEINFTEFLELSKLLFMSNTKSKMKGNRIPRMYITPDMYDKYSTIFRHRAGSDGQLDQNELQDFFAFCKIQVSAERLISIMTDVDQDQSGYLDESEFMILLIKALGLSKRKVGPGMCSLNQLVEEGWSHWEIRKAGFECHHFLEAGCPVGDLMEVFTAGEMKRAGVSFMDLMNDGWDCLQAREAGFELSELVNAGCSIRKMRYAGWDDLASAAQLRKLGISAAKMKLGGWTMSILKRAGYSTADLRLAGFSSAGLAAVQSIVGRPNVPHSIGRQGTMLFREEADLRLEH